MIKAKTPVVIVANEPAQFGEEVSKISIGSGGEWQLLAVENQPALTTNQGLPIADNQNSLRAHPSGPTLLEDFILREKITHLDHERIPERIVHACGTGAHGFFELTESLEKYTMAKVLTEVGEQTPLFTRITANIEPDAGVVNIDDVDGFIAAAKTRQWEREAGLRTLA